MSDEQPTVSDPMLELAGEAEKEALSVEKGRRLDFFALDKGGIDELL